MAPEPTIREVFDEAQKGMQGHGKLIKMLVKIYNKKTFDEFFEDFLHHVKFSMVVMKREPAVERTLEFVAKFATTLKAEEEQMDDIHGNIDDVNKFLLKLFQFFLKHHNANSAAVRFRCCYMINKLFNNMGDDAEIDEDLFDKIYNTMIERLRDKFPVVRVQAVLALSRLQDPLDKDCAVIKAYIFAINCDPNPDVRRAVLQVIAPSTKTLADIMGRTRDVKEAVRRTAFQILGEKVHIRALSIAQRVKILERGLNDRSASVRDACSAKLLQAWLRTFNTDILELLKCLDVENSADISEKMLMAFFKKVPTAELVSNFDLLNDTLLLPMESLTEESALYWRVLSEHVYKGGLETQDQLDRVLPTASVYSEYLHSIQEMMEAETNEDKQLGNEFIMLQLLTLAGVLDLSDEVGRRKLSKQLRGMLLSEAIPHTLVKPIVRQLTAMTRDPHQRVRDLLEVISEIREPVTTSEEQDLPAAEKRKLDLQLAGVRVELNQVRDDLDQAVRAQDFARAAELKEAVALLEARRQEILDSSKPQTQEVRVERNDARTMVKCLTIVCEMLQDAKITSMTPSLQTLLDVMILPSVQRTDPVVRNIALRCLGVCCVLDKQLARKHILLFVTVSQIDQDTVVVTALQALFDSLLMFGFDTFTKPDTEQGEDEKTGEQANDNDEVTSEVTVVPDSDPEDEVEPLEKRTATVVSDLLNILLGLLDSDVSEVRTVVAEGLCKLLVTGRVVSSKLLTRLILLWYSPLTAEDTHLRHCLGTFFPLYAFASRSNQEVFAEAFLPTLTALFEAPSSSPLAEVNVDNVAELLIQLTNQRLLVRKPTLQVAGCHDNLAVAVCNEVLTDPNAFSTRTWCKLLNLFELSVGNTAAARDLCELARKMLKTVKDKLSVKSIEKFHKSVRLLCGADKDVSPPDDLDNDKESEVTIADSSPVVTAPQKLLAPSDNRDDSETYVSQEDSDANSDVNRSRVILPLDTSSRVSDQTQLTRVAKRSRAAKKTAPLSSLSESSSGSPVVKPKTRKTRAAAQKSVPNSQSETQSDEDFQAVPRSKRTSRRKSRSPLEDIRNEISSG